jgi:hypothetical protein
MSSQTHNQKNAEIKKLKEEIVYLKEYLLSDCCKQCSFIVNKIEKYQKEIELLTHEYIR